MYPFLLPHVTDMCSLAALEVTRNHQCWAQIEVPAVLPAEALGENLSQETQVPVLVAVAFLVATSSQSSKPASPPPPLPPSHKDTPDCSEDPPQKPTISHLKIFT